MKEPQLGYRLHFLCTVGLLLIGILVWSGDATAQTSLQRMREINPDIQDPPPIDEERVAAAGIRKITGKFVSLYTDIRDRPDIDELPGVFDQAVPQWCQHFGIDLQKTEGWHVRAMIIADKEKFRAAKLMDDRLPEFPAGLHIGHDMWVYLQPGEYYTRHLLLHEGTHAFMTWFLGGLGAPWYAEGMAELMGIHAWTDSRLKLNFRLTQREQAPYWGRIKTLNDDHRNGKTMSLDQILAIQPRAFREVRSYAWSWAACEFFSSHPKTREAFADLKDLGRRDQHSFNQKFEQAILDHRTQLNRDWQLFIDEVDFGFEVARAAIREIEPTAPNQFELDVSAGWHVTTLEVKAGESVQIKTKGRFVVAMEGSTPWHCESNGISIEYYRGKPLGQLLVGVLDTGDESVTGLAEPVSLPENGVLEISHSGRLCFRINESPARLSDNSGQLKIFVRSTGR